MFYIRDRFTKLILKGMGRGFSYRGHDSPIWGAKSEIECAKVFLTIEKAKAWIKNYHLRNVEILNVVLEPVWQEEYDNERKDKSA